MTAAPTPLPQPARAHRVAVGARTRQLLWLLAAAAGGFLVPYVFADRLDVPRDGYYAIYCGAVFAFFLAWTRANGISPRALLARNWPWALLLGAAFGGVLAAIALTFDATSHPRGFGFAGAILWRGVVYGAADGLLLGAFPVLAVFAAFPFVRGRAHAWRTLGTGALALLAAVGITAAFHLGYPDFRGEKLTKPMRGAAIWTAPTLLTLNPLGSVVAHVGQHVTAVVHSYNGDTYLPPHGEAAPTIALRPCTVGAALARCGTLAVAENPADPGGRKLALNVAVFPARSGHPKADPLFWFAGWGSGGVTDDAAGVISAFADLNVDRDVVFIDQRGTGGTKLVCAEPPPVQLAAGDVGAVTAATRRCVERIGPRLRHYTSAVAVDDFDRVRRALGYERINVYGGSYGVTTGLIYLQRHGDRVRSAVFDSGSLLDVRIFERAAPNMQRSLDLLFARCAANVACNNAYPHLRAEFAALQKRLARSPVPVAGSPVPLTPMTFASVLSDLIAYTPGKALAPRAIHLVATGRLADAAAAMGPTADDTSDQLAYQLLIQCNEPWASWRPAEVARLARGTYVEAGQNLRARIVQAACKAIPKADVPAAVGERVRSTVPVLFLTGNEDGADPPGNIANASRELPNSRTVLFPMAGHGQLGQPCAQELIRRFVATGTAAGLDTSCARTAALQPFDTRE